MSQASGTYIATVDGVQYYTDRVVKGGISISAKVGYLEYSADYDVYGKNWSESTGVSTGVQVGKGGISLGVDSDGNLRLGGGWA